MKPTDFNFNQLSSSFLDDVQAKIDGKTGTTLDIIEFIDKEVNLGIELYPQQKVVLKAFYGLDLNEEERSILDYWKFQGFCKSQDNYEHQALILNVGRRGSKTLLSSLIVAYEFYKLCVLDSPQEHYSISRSSWISILVLATTATQSKDTIFGSVLGVFQNCRYFKNLEDKGDLFIGKEYITLESKLITIKSGNSKSAAQVGGNLIALVMDEFALFTGTEEESDAISLWSSLGISLSPFGLSGKRLAISSAICHGDAIEELIDLVKDDPTMMTLKVSSWDINPSIHPDINNITASEYKMNAVRAALEFENKRTQSESAYLNSTEINQAFRSKSTIDVEASLTVINESTLAIVDVKSIQPSTVMTFLHIDSSIVTDNYAVAYGHVYIDSTTKLSTLAIDGILLWEPDKLNNIPVYFKNVYDTIIQIHKVRPLTLITSDPYAASAETLQNLNNFGIKTKVITFSNPQQLIMYNSLNTLLKERRVVFPTDSPWSKLLEAELSNVLLIKNGKSLKIDHPSKFSMNGITVKGSKDIADCVASIAWNVVTHNVIVSSQNIEVKNTNIPKPAPGMVSDYSSPYNIESLIPKLALTIEDKYKQVRKYVRRGRYY